MIQVLLLLILLSQGSDPLRRISAFTHSKANNDPVLALAYTHGDAGQLTSESTSSPHPSITSS